MCLAIPGKVVEWIRRDPPFSEAWVEFGGTRRRVNLSLVAGIDVDHYVLVHAGVAIQKVNEREAERTLQLLNDIESHLEDDGSFGRSDGNEAS
jgi:hydrogenase expression/formation protein HypC